MLEMAVESMEMAFGGNFPSRQGARTETSVPRTRVCDDGRDGILRGFLLGYLGFSRDGEYMGEEAESESTRWAQTTPRRGQSVGRAWPWSGQVAGLLLLPFGLRLRIGRASCRERVCQYV